MKLKRLLCGVTAAIMALSSVAIASFTSASAADETGLITPSNCEWYTRAQQEDTTQFKLCQEYDPNSMPIVEDLVHAKELYIAFTIVNVNVDHPLKAFMIYSNGYGWESDYTKPGTNNPAT